MTNSTLNKLQNYGSVFQVKVLGALLTQRDFLLNISDSLDSEYFENPSKGVIFVTPFFLSHESKNHHFILIVH